MEGPALDAATTRARALDAVARFLERSGVEEPRRDARALLLAADGLSALDLVTEPDAPLCDAARARLRESARRRAAREPVSRILGARGFWRQELVVAPQVLDPRPDTESLVELALALLRARRDEPLRILDLGVGSGALLCALLCEFPSAWGVGVDLSPHACAAAARNVARCGLAARAAILRGRWAEALGARFDLIVSNPPYVASADIETLAPEVRLHDPRLALDGGPDGLDRYRELAETLPRLLDSGGFAVLEAGAGQARAIAALLAGGGLALAAIGRDAEGRERAVAARPAREIESAPARDIFATPTI